MALTGVGQGKLGYVGEINEDETDAVFLAMLGLRSAES